MKRDGRRWASRERQVMERAFQGAGRVRARATWIVCAAALCVGGAIFVGACNHDATAAAHAPAFLGKVGFKEIPGEGSESLFFKLQGMAVDNNTGNVYVASEARVIEFSAWGAFTLEFGTEVDQTQVEKREHEQANKETVTVTAEQGDICTEASGDSCGAGNEVGQLKEAEGLAVEQSTGDVYVVDSAHERIVKFDADGHFILTFGSEVNKTAVEESGTRSSEENICPAAGHPGDVCQPGKTGGGVGQFEAWRKKEASFIAVGGPSEYVYVGDKARIQAFNAQGEQQQEISLSSLSSSARVNALAVDAAGNIYFADENIDGVREIESGTTLVATSFAGYHGRAAD